MSAFLRRHSSWFEAVISSFPVSSCSIIYVGVSAGRLEIWGSCVWTGCKASALWGFASYYWN